MDRRQDLSRDLDELRVWFQLLLEEFLGCYQDVRIRLRVCLLVLAEIMTTGRRTVTGLLRTLGETVRDWSAWYRLFRLDRIQVERWQENLARHTIAIAKESGGMYRCAIDAVHIHRSGKKIFGVSWTLGKGTAKFNRGLQLSQRVVILSYIPPAEEGGWTTAIPVRLDPAFVKKEDKKEEETKTKKGKKKGKDEQQEPEGAKDPFFRKPWEAALEQLKWLQGMKPGELLVVCDGGFDASGFWSGLPDGMYALVRTARNRCLYALPDNTERRRGRKRKYGERLPSPRELLRQIREWRKAELEVRGRELKLKYAVIGPVLRQGAAEKKLFLLVVRGQVYYRGKEVKRRKYREPTYLLVNARELPGGRCELPAPPEVLLESAWQRWEVETMHRDVKSRFGLGHKQSWTRMGTVRALQWSVAVFGFLKLVMYKAFGVTGRRERPERWWRGSGRRSFETSLRLYRQMLWDTGQLMPSRPEEVKKWVKVQEKGYLRQLTLNAVLRSG